MVETNNQISLIDFGKYIITVHTSDVKISSTVSLFKIYSFCK